MEELLDITKGQKPEGLDGIERDENGNVTNDNTEETSDDIFNYKPSFSTQHDLDSELSHNYYGNLGTNVGGLGWEYIDYGESKYDEAAESIGDLQDLNEVRAREQDWYEKIGIGLGKFGVETANTAVGNILGTFVGIGQGIANVTDDDDTTTFWQGLWNNEVTKVQNEIREWQEKAMPIYRSKYEQNMGAIRSIITASSFSDLIAQAGFTSGMLLSSYLTGGMGIGSGAASLMKALGASEKAANWAYRLICGVTGALSEASMEALNAYNDTKQHYIDKINKKYNIQSQIINNQIEKEVWNELLRRDPNYFKTIHTDKTLENEIRQNIANNYKGQLDEIEKNKAAEMQSVEERALSAGSMVYGLNTAIVGGSNILGSLSFLKAPSQNAKRQIAKGFGQRVKEMGRRDATKPYGEGISVTEARLTGLRAGLMEGFEESNQKWASTIAEQYYGSSYDPSATDKFSKFLETSLQTFKTVYSDPETWKEWTMGAIIGLTGVFNPGGFGKLAKGQKVKFGDFWQGGMIEAWQEGKKLSDNSRKAYNEMNRFATDKKLQSNVRLALFNIASKERQMQAAAKGNKLEYEDENDAQAIKIAQTFADAGKLNDFEALVGQNDNISDEELDFLCDGLTVKGPDGKYVSEYSYLLTENGEKISNILDKDDPIRKKAKEKIAKESKRLHNVIKQYQDVLNDTDKETGYSLSRDQLGVLTMLKVRKNLSEVRQDDITKKLNDKISWDDIADYFDSFKNLAESNKKVLGQKIKRLEEIINNYNKKKEITKLSEADEKNEKIFQSELDKMKLLFQQYDKSSKNKEEKEGKEEEPEKTSIRIIMEKIKEALSNNDKGGAFLASILNQNLGTKENPYFLAESVAEALYALYGEDANDMILQMEDLIKLQKHAYAYDELYRTYIGAPDKIHQMLNKVLTNANNSRIRQKSFNTLKSISDDETANAKLIEDALNTEQDENDKIKLEEELSKNLLVKQYLDKKHFQETVSKALDAAIKSNENVEAKRLIDSAKHLFELDNLDKTSALYKSAPEYWYTRAVEEGYDEEAADAIKNILNQTIEALRQMNFSMATATDKLIQEANEKNKGQNTNTGEKVTVPKVDTVTLDDKVIEYLVKNENLQKLLSQAVQGATVGKEKHYIGNKGECNKVLLNNEEYLKNNKKDVYNAITGFRVQAMLMAKQNPEVAKNLLETADYIINLISCYPNVTFGEADYCLDCNAMSRYKPKNLEDLKKMFPNSKVEIVEDDNYPEDTALLTQSYFEETPNGLVHHVTFVSKKQQVKSETGTDSEEIKPPVVPEEVKTNAALQQAQIKISEIINKLNKQVFIKEEEKSHTYYIYQGSNSDGGAAAWDKAKDKINRENAKSFDFTYADVTVSGLYYDYLDKQQSFSSNPNKDYAIAVGNDIDYICREYFKGTPIETIKNKKMFLISTDEKGNIEADATVKIFEALDEIKEQIQKKHGQNCIFITDPINMVATYTTKSNNNTLNRIVGGAPDMIVIDESGVAHIYDFKGKKIQGKTNEEKLISKEHPNSYEDPQTHIITNDYDGYSAQTFAYAKILKELGFENVDLTQTTLIQFDTTLEQPVYLGKLTELKIDDRKIISDIMNGIHSYNFQEAAAQHQVEKEEQEKKRREEEAARIKAIQDEQERKKQEEIERKKQEEFEAKKRQEAEEKAAIDAAEKAAAEKARLEREEQAKAQQEIIDKLKQDIESQEDKIFQAEEEEQTKTNIELQALNPSTASISQQHAFIFAERLQYNEEKEALGEYQESESIDVLYLKSQGAYAYNDDGDIKKTSSVFFRDISKERAEWVIQYKKAKGENKPDINLIPEHPVIGMFVQKRDGTMQIIGVLRYDSGSIKPNNANGSEDGIGRDGKQDTARSIRNSISELILPNSLFEDRTTKIEVNGKEMLQVYLYNRSNQIPNKGSRRQDNTSQTGVINTKDGVKNVNIQAQKDEIIEVDGQEYISIKNADGQPLTVRFLPGRIQERPKKNGERDFKPITSVQHINTDFNTAFKDNKLYLGVINDEGVYAIAEDGKSFRISDIEIPKDFKEGANVVIFKGGDGKYRVSLVTGTVVNQESVKASSNSIATKLKNSIYNKTVDDKGSEKTSGIVSMLTMLAYINDLGLVNDETYSTYINNFNSNLNNIFNNLNIGFVKNSATYDLKTNTLSFKIGKVSDNAEGTGVKGEQTITLAFGSVTEFGKSKEAHSENAEKLIYNLLENIGARYSIRLPQFYKNEKNTTKESQEAAKEYINSIKDLMETTIANFSTRNTRPVVTYYSKSDISKVSTENRIKNSITFGNIDIVFDDDKFYAERDGKVLSNSATVKELCDSSVLSDRDLVAKNLKGILNYLYVVSKKFPSVSRDTNNDGYNIKDGVLIIETNKDTKETILVDLVTQKVLSTDKAIEFQEKHKPVTEAQSYAEKSGFVFEPVSEFRQECSFIEVFPYGKTIDTIQYRSEVEAKRVALTMLTIFKSAKDYQDLHDKVRSKNWNMPASNWTYTYGYWEAFKDGRISEQDVLDLYTPFSYGRISVPTNNQTPQQGQTQTPSAPSTKGPIRKPGQNKTISRGKKREGKSNANRNYTAGTHNVHQILDNTNLAIASLLKTVISEDTELEVLTDQEYNQKFGDSLGVTYKGRVYLRESSTENTMIHELCHYVVPSVIQNLEAATELKEIFNQFKRYLEIHPELKDELSYDGVSVEYATTNLYEFLSELFSNEKTAAVLQSIPDDYFVYDEIEHKDNINPKYADAAGFIDNEKVSINASNKSLLNRIIDTIINFFKSKSKEIRYVPNNIYKIAEKAGKELIKSFKEDKINATKTDSHYRQAKKGYQYASKTPTRQQEFESNIHKIMPTREYSLNTKQSFSRLNEAGILYKGFNLAKTVKQNNTNDNVFEMFKAILPIVYQRDMNKQDIESYVEKYYDAIYGYDITEEGQNLSNLVSALQDYTLVMPLAKYMISEKNGNKKFGYSNLDSIFASELKESIERCTL